MIKASRKKPARTSSEPKPLRTNWLQDDFYESTSKEFSYIPMMSRFHAIHNTTGKIKTFRKLEQAEKYARGRNCWVHSSVPTEEVAHELRQKELAEIRWEGGYGA